MREEQEGERNKKERTDWMRKEIEREREWEKRNFRVRVNLYMLNNNDNLFIIMLGWNFRELPNSFEYHMTALTAKDPISVMLFT